MTSRLITITLRPDGTLSVTTVREERRFHSSGYTSYVVTLAAGVNLDAALRAARLWLADEMETGA